MPELPEVETVLRTLESRIKGKRIVGIEILYSNIVECDNNEFIERLTGQSFSGFKRRGKYLLFEMEDLTLVSHLRMEGKYYILDKSVPRDKHTHVVFELDDGMELRYHDVRKFGRMELIEHGDYKVFKDLGPEPFSDEFSSEYVKAFIKNLKQPVKQLLLRQDFVAGIGNIYADEICFMARISPLKPADKLSLNEIRLIIDSTRKILSEAIAAGGTTIRSYTSSLGVTGRFQQSLNVHTKENCPLCANPIRKIRISGRGTYYCPICQK